MSGKVLPAQSPTRSSRVSENTSPNSDAAARQRQKFTTGISSKWFWLLTVLGAIVLVFWLSPWREATPPAALPEALSDEPDLYISQAKITQFQVSGMINYKLFAQEIRHFQKDDLTKLFSPHLVLHNEDKPPWDVSALKGFIRKEESPTGEMEEVVYLEQEVVMEHERGNDTYLRVKSETMRLYPDRKFAETEQDVIIDTNVGRTKAGALKGDLANGVMHLFSSKTQRVQTIILPDQFK